MSYTRQYEIEVISPVHIGSGVTISPIEYVVEDKFYRVEFYKTLHEESNKLSKNESLLHISWGSGWHGMTIGELFDVEMLRRNFDLVEPEDGVEKIHKSIKLKSSVNL